MFMQRIKLQNILSFGPDAQDLEFKPLNVLIGPNSSGKSNLVEVIALLRAAPRDLTKPITQGGGVGNWIWRGVTKAPAAHVEVIVANADSSLVLRHRLAFAETDYRIQLTDEQIAKEDQNSGRDEPCIYFELGADGPIFNGPIFNPDRNKKLTLFHYKRSQSILSQIRDPFHHPELTWLGDMYPRIRPYREWTFGRNATPREPQDAALPNDFLTEGGQNLGLVLNRLKRDPVTKNRFLDALRNLYEGVEDFDVIVEGGTVQVMLQEGDITVPAVRLSDGTLRYLCLLAILCHPTPPPLICIEEPELGLHPDILPGLADLLREASERCQLIVTTHSDTLVDALTDTPESVVVCEKEQGQTRMKRLDKVELSHWLEKYRLGELWSSGELGGNRW